MKYTQQSQPNIHGCLCKLCLLALTKRSYLDMQLTLLRSPPISASRRDCIEHARDALLKKMVGIRRLSPYQESSFSMDGEYSPPSTSQPTCRKPKTCRTEGHRVQKPSLRKTPPDNLKKRHVRSWQRHTRIRQKTAPTHAELPFERANISGSWWIGMAKLFTRYTWLPESTHSRVKKQRQLNSSTNPPVAPCPWPMAKIAIDMEKPAQWVTKMCRLYFTDIYARRTEGTPKAFPAPGVGSTLREVEQFLPDLEAKMIEFLAEWVQSRSLSGRHVSTSFLDPVLGAMMKQVCWHSRRIKAHRGLPEARGQSEAHGDSNLYTRRPQIQTFCTHSSFPSPHPQDQGCVMVLSVRSSQQDIVVNLDSGGCGGVQQARVMFVCENYQRRCQSLYWLDRNTSMLRCETTKDNVTTLYWLCRKTTMLLCENY